MSNETENKNIHAGHRKRVKERFLKSGISAFDDYQLLEFLMFYVHKRKDTNEIGHKLINEFGNLENVFSASFDELCSVDGVGEAGATLITFVGQMRNRISQKPLGKDVYLENTLQTGKFCIEYFKNLSTERLVLLSFNSERKLLGVDVISDGDYSATVVDIRKILSVAIKRKATMVVISHNHPGDTPHPSDADIAITKKVVDVLEAINIMVADHIVCNDYSYVSMEERGLMCRGRY